MSKRPDPLAHGRSRYRQGCRCGVCREANREYQRRYRSKTPLHPLPSPPAGTTPEDPAPAGPVAAAVRAQIENLSGAEERPALAAVAIVLAELLDNDRAVPQHPAAAHRLVETLDKLGRSPAARGRLKGVRGLTPR